MIVSEMVQVAGRRSIRCRFAADKALAAVQMTLADHGRLDLQTILMVICICPDMGLFYRINSYDEYPIAVPIPREPDHLFRK